MNTISRSGSGGESPRMLPALAISPRGSVPLTESSGRKLLKINEEEQENRYDMKKFREYEAEDDICGDEISSKFGDISLSSGKTSQESELLSLRTGKTSLSSSRLSKSSAKSAGSSSMPSISSTIQDVRESVIEEDRQIRDKFYGVKSCEEAAAAKEQFVDPFVQQFRPYAGRRRRRLNGSIPEDPRLGPGVVSVFRGSSLMVAGAAAAVAATRGDQSGTISDAAAGDCAGVHAGVVHAELSVLSTDSHHAVTVNGSNNGSSSSSDDFYFGSDTPMRRHPAAEMNSSFSSSPRGSPRRGAGRYTMERPSSAQSSVYSGGSSSSSATRHARHLVESHLPLTSPTSAAVVIAEGGWASSSSSPAAATASKPHSPGNPQRDNNSSSSNSSSKISNSRTMGHYNRMVAAPYSAPLPAVDVLGGGTLVDKRSAAAAVRKGKHSADSYSYDPDCPRKSGPGAALYSLENA